MAQNSIRALQKEAVENFEEDQGDANCLEFRRDPQPYSLSISNDSNGFRWIHALGIISTKSDPAEAMKDALEQLKKTINDTSLSTRLKTLKEKDMMLKRTALIILAAK